MVMAVAMVALSTMVACAGKLGVGKCIKAERNVSAKELSLGAFNAVDVSGRLEVKVSQGAASPVKVTGPSNLLEYVVGEVKEGTLYLSVKDGVCFDYPDKCPEIEIAVSMPDVTGVAVSGQSEVEFVTAVHTNGRLTVNASGQSDVDFKQPVTAQALAVTVRGQSDFDMAGCRADILNVDVAGQSDCDLKGRCDAKDVKLSMSGQSDTDCGDIYCSMLSISTSGQSDFKCKGEINADRAELGASGQSGIKLSHGTIKSISSRSTGQSDISLGKVNAQYPNE